MTAVTRLNSNLPRPVEAPKENASLEPTAESGESSLQENVERKLSSSLKPFRNPQVDSKRFGSAESYLNPNVPAVEETPPSPCDPLFETFPKQELKAFPKSLRLSCGDERLPVEQIRFFDLKVRRGGITYRVKHGRQLMKTQGTYRLAKYFFPALIDPPEGLRVLISEVLQRNGGKKIPLVLEGKVTRTHMGFFRGSRASIHLFDTLSQPKGKKVDYGVMDRSTLHHEMGHHLMYLLYGKKFPSYEGHEGHDREAEKYEDAVTNPGAAWSEGFAGAMGNLDGRGHDGLFSSTELSDAWFKKDLKNRLSNEYVITALLSEYIQSREKRGSMVYVVFNQDSKARLEKIFACMESSGLQKDFGVFAGDFLEQFPEEASRFKPLLGKYGFSESLQD